MPEIKTQFHKGRNLSEFLESLRLGEHRPGLGKQRPISTSTLSEAANPTFTNSLKEFIFPERNRNGIIALDFGRRTGFSSNAARKLMRAFIGSIAKRTNSRDLTSFEKKNGLLSGGVRNSANGRNAAAFASSYRVEARKPTARANPSSVRDRRNSSTKRRRAGNPFFFRKARRQAERAFSSETAAANSVDYIRRKRLRIRRDGLREHIRLREISPRLLIFQIGRSMLGGGVRGGSCYVTQQG